MISNAPTVDLRFGSCIEWQINWCNFLWITGLLLSQLSVFIACYRLGWKCSGLKTHATQRVYDAWSTPRASGRTCVLFESQLELVAVSGQAPFQLRKNNLFFLKYDFILKNWFLSEYFFFLMNFIILHIQYMYM